MKKLIISAVAVLTALGCIAADTAVFEAENFKGNGVVLQAEDASGGQYVSGKQWYEFIKNVPIPEKSQYCFIRVKSSAPANWFLAYNPKKPFGWFKTDGKNQWQWVCLGKFTRSDNNNALMPTVFLHRSSNPALSGMVDLILFAPGNKVSDAEKVFAAYQNEKSSDGAFYLESESYVGNGFVVNAPGASGGKIVTGKTWYVMMKELPIPESANGMYCLVRAKSSLKAQWFLAYDTKKPFGWFQTPGEEKWVWVNLGRFRKTAENRGIMPQVFLQRPIGSSAKTVDGAVDAVIFSETPDIKAAEKMFQEKLHKAPEKIDAASAEKLSKLLNIQRVYCVWQVDKAPKIDGEINDEAYRNIPEASDFILMGGKGVAGEKTAVKAVWHKDTLYIAAKLYESRMPLLRKLRTRDNDSVWTDDCFEIYFDPGHTRQKAFQLVVNPNGAKQDSSLKRRIDEAGFSDLKLTWQVKTSLKRDHWCVEAAIPLKLLTFDEVKEGTVWGVNFCRSEIPSGEKSYWNNTGEYFFKPERYALLHFGKTPGNLQNVALDSDSGVLKLEFAPEKREKITLSGMIGKTPVSAPVPAVLEAGKVQMMKLPAQSAARKYTVDVTLSGKDKSTSFAVDVRNYRDGLLSVIWPSEERNNRLPILYGTAQHSFWLFGNHTKNTVESLQAVIELPDGLIIHDPASDIQYSRYRNGKIISREKITRNQQPYTRYTIAIEGKLGPNEISKVQFFNGLPVYIECTDPALSGKKMPIYTYIQAGKLVEEETETTVEVLPPVAVKAPEKLIIHNWLWTWHPAKNTLDATLRTMQKAGFNSLEVDDAQFYPGRREAFAKYGFPLINNMWWEFHGSVPGAEAVKFDGTKDKGHLCPVKMVADNGKLLLANREKLLRDVAGGTRGIIWDLEGPYCWNICFCAECIASFRKFAGIGSSVKLTPALIRENYNGQWIKFCCRQSTDICKILRDNIKKINPEASFGFYSGLPSFDTMESYRADWEDAAGVIDLALLSYYTNSFASLSDTFGAKMKEHIAHLRSLARKKGNNDMAVWATLTPGYGRNRAMKPAPELVKLKVLRSFASGMDGVTFWWWGPFDGDYYAQLAAASAIVGRYEKFFLKKESPISLKIGAAKADHSIFTSAVDGEEFLLIMNHGSKSLKLSVDNPSERVWKNEFTGKSFTGSAFAVETAPYGATVLYSGKR